MVGRSVSQSFGLDPPCRVVRDVNGVKPTKKWDAKCHYSERAAFRWSFVSTDTRIDTGCDDVVTPIDCDSKFGETAKLVAGSHHR